MVLRIDTLAIELAHARASISEFSVGGSAETHRGTAIRQGIHKEIGQFAGRMRASSPDGRQSGQEEYEDRRQSGEAIEVCRKT